MRARGVIAALLLATGAAAQTYDPPANGDSLSSSAFHILGKTLVITCDSGRGSGAHTAPVPGGPYVQVFNAGQSILSVVFCVGLPCVAGVPTITSQADFLAAPGATITLAVPASAQYVSVRAFGGNLGSYVCYITPGIGI